MSPSAIQVVHMRERSRRVEIYIDVEDDVDFCSIDFPGGVYGAEARISFFGSSRQLLRCRKATEQELILLQMTKIEIGEKE